MNLHVVLYHLERFVAWAQWDLNEVGPSSWVDRHENGEADIKIDIFQNFFAVLYYTILYHHTTVMLLGVRGSSNSFSDSHFV